MAGAASALVIAPPLTIAKNEIDHGIDGIERDLEVVDAGVSD